MNREDVGEGAAHDEERRERRREERARRSARTPRGGERRLSRRVARPSAAASARRARPNAHRLLDKERGQEHRAEHEEGVDRGELEHAHLAVDSGSERQSGPQKLARLPVRPHAERRGRGERAREAGERHRYGAQRQLRPRHDAGDPRRAAVQRHLAHHCVRPRSAQHNEGGDFQSPDHNHNYETTWPMAHNMTVGPLSYIDPRAPIHILSGTAGPPAWDAFKEIGAPWTREPRILANSYSRMTLWNASVATFEQVGNDNGTLLDSWTIVQRRRNRSAPFKVRTTATGLRRGAGTE